MTVSHRGRPTDATRRLRFGLQIMGVIVLWALLATSCRSGPTGRAEAGECPPERSRAEQVAELVVAPLLEPAWTLESEEETFSSPRAVDLNRDGVLDIVQGFGQDTFGARESSVLAINGATGEELWRSSGHEDLIGSATFANLGGDDTPDVVIGGRRGALLALDGATGSELWTFDDRNGLWFNFYTSQIVADHNDDGVVEVVAANGGLVFDGPEEGGGLPDPDERHLGTTFVVSGADGSVISSVPVPDRGESYMSPLVVPSVDREGVDVLIGTGGETLPGSLWRIPLASLVAADDDEPQVVVSGGDKGVIATPSLGHLTPDCVLDVVVQSFDGTLTALDGAAGHTVWTAENPGFETYSTPTLGYFVGEDAVPDVFAAIAKGVWPEYDASDYVLIDGATGQVVWRETLGTFAPSGFVAADLNSDGRDEVVFGVNELNENIHDIHVLDPSRLELHPLLRLDQTTFSSPWIGDLDDNGQLDLIVVASAYQSQGHTTMHRYELSWDTPEHIAWGGYLGTDGSGVLDGERIESVAN